MSTSAAQDEQPPDPSATEGSTAPIHYTLDPNDRIIDVRGGWDDFAVRNDAADLRIDHVIGRSLFQFIKGSPTRSLYHQLFERVRQTGQPLELPFRCDAPDRCRALRLGVASTPGGTLAVESRIIREWPRPAVHLLSRRVVRGNTQLRVCSICRRAHVGDGQWLEPDEALRQYPIFDTLPAPRLEEDICDLCEQVQAGCRYLVHTRGDASTPRPLLIFLHGGAQTRWLLRLHAPPRLAEQYAIDGDYVLLSPLCSPANQWDSIDLPQILAEVQARYPIDPTRIYLTGISAGATAIWKWAQQQPHRFAGLVPIAGAIFDDPAIHHIPTWIFHGEKDPMLPLSFMTDTLEQLRSSNPQARITIYTERGHEVWPLAYSDPSLWSWLFSQRREVPAAPP